MSKKTNKSPFDLDANFWYYCIGMIVVYTIIEMAGCYCNEHEEEHRKEERERFEERVQRIHYIKWESE